MPLFSNAENIIKIRGPQSEYDASHSYYKGLIELAFSKMNKDVTLTYSPYMVQGRALAELKDNRLLDIYWAGSDALRDKELGVVDIPLLKGLLGYRLMLSHKDNYKKLNKIDTLKDLKQLSMCQGSHWPDTDILLAAGLNVVPNPIYENMFTQVNYKRCDVFPRGVSEVYSEFNARKKLMPNLILFKKLAIYYPFPMYFYTSPHNTKLRDFLTQGLERAIDDGSYDQYIKNHPTTKHLFPLSKWKKLKIININNPFLSTTIDTKNNRYWVDLNQ